LRSPDLLKLSEKPSTFSGEVQLEGINCIVQAASAEARGYCASRSLKAVTYPIDEKPTLNFRREISEGYKD
jgi:hypothetical protein